MATSCEELKNWLETELTDCPAPLDAAQKVIVGESWGTRINTVAQLNAIIADANAAPNNQFGAVLCQTLDATGLTIPENINFLNVPGTGLEVSGGGVVFRGHLSDQNSQFFFDSGSAVGQVRPTRLVTGLGKAGEINPIIFGAVQAQDSWEAIQSALDSGETINGLLGHTSVLITGVYRSSQPISMRVSNNTSSCVLKGTSIFESRINFDNLGAVPCIDIVGQDSRIENLMVDAGDSQVAINVWGNWAEECHIYLTRINNFSEFGLVSSVRNVADTIGNTQDGNSNFISTGVRVINSSFYPNAGAKACIYSGPGVIQTTLDQVTMIGTNATPHDNGVVIEGGTLLGSSINTEGSTVGINFRGSQDPNAYFNPTGILSNSGRFISLRSMSGNSDTLVRINTPETHVCLEFLFDNVIGSTLIDDVTVGETFLAVTTNRSLGYYRRGATFNAIDRPFNIAAPVGAYPDNVGIVDMN